MAVLTFPDITPNSAVWSLEHNTRQFTSPLSKATQTLESPGARWKATLTFKNLTQAKARTLFAFLAQLGGAAGRFYLHDHSLPTPMGSPSESPVVNGADQVGSSLVTKDWPADAIAVDDYPGYVDDAPGYVDDLGAGTLITVLKAGDYFGVNNELKIMTEDAITDGLGNVTLKYAPPARSAPVDGAVISYDKPKCIMRLVDDNQINLAARPGNLGNITISCVESFT